MEFLLIPENEQGRVKQKTGGRDLIRRRIEKRWKLKSF
jgi:hypothetical protein